MTAVPMDDQAYATGAASHRAPDDWSWDDGDDWPAEQPTVGARLLALRQRLLAVRLEQEGWLLAGGSALALLGVVLAVVSWPSMVTDEFGSVVQGSAAWSAVGIAVAAIGGLLCVAAAAAYGVLLGQQHATRGHARD